MSVAKPYKAGWIIESFIQIRSTDGLLRHIPGAACGLIARITVANDKAPELPNLQMFEDINWKYLTTEVAVDGLRVIYEFELDDEDADKLRTVVWFMDTLYG